MCQSFLVIGEFLKKSILSGMVVIVFVRAVIQPAAVINWSIQVEKDYLFMLFRDTCD